MNIYRLLIQSTRALIQTCSRSSDILNDNTLELDTALRQTVLTVEHQKDSESRAASEEGVAEALNDLLSQLQMAMKGLRRNGLEAILFPQDYSTTVVADPAAADEKYVALLQTSPWLPSIISKALTDLRESTRYAALTILHDDESNRLLTTENQNQFKEAGLMESLTACLMDAENFELVSGILSKLVDIENWRQEIQAKNTIAAYEKAASMVMSSNAATLRRLEVYLKMWKACRGHSDCALNTAMTVFRATQGLKTVAKEVHTVPYIPPSLEGHIEELRKARGYSERAAVMLGTSFEEMQTIYAAFKWTMAN